jgi:hypothetical protein
MTRKASSSIAPHRSAMRDVAMNMALVMLLAGVFLWSVTGNAIDQLRAAIERRA